MKNQIARLLLIAFISKVCLVHSQEDIDDQVEPHQEEQLGPGVIGFLLALDWTQLWKMDATIDEVPEQERKDWIEDTLRIVMLMMKRKFNHPKLTDFNVVSFEDNSVLVEFPSLTDQTKQNIETIATDLLKTVTVQTVGGAFIDGQKVDLFGREAAKEARQRARKREREANKKYGIDAKTDEQINTVDDLRKKRERQQEDELKQNSRAEKEEARKERMEKREKMREERLVRLKEAQKESREVNYDLEMLDQSIEQMQADYNRRVQEQQQREESREQQEHLEL